MKRLDSSCEEADSIINDALLKLKGSCVNNTLQHISSLQNISSSQQEQHSHQEIQGHSNQQQKSSLNIKQLPQTSILLQNASTTSSLLNTNTNKQPSSSYVFNMSSSNYAKAKIIKQYGHIVLATSPASSETLNSPGSSTSTLSNNNSISPTVPDMILSTSSTSPTIQQLPKTGMLSSSSLPTPSTSSVLSPQSSVPAKIEKRPHSIEKNSVDNNLPSSAKKSKFSDSTSSSSLSKEAYKFLPYVDQSEATLNTGNINTNTIPPISAATLPKSIHNIKSTPSHCSSSQSTKDKNSNTTSTSPNLSSVHSPYFDIHDKVKKTYFQLLINDDVLFKENMQKHRTRSFVLERLVEEEKLNAIVVSLYPGNKGYSLAVLCHEMKLYESLNERLSTTGTDTGGNSDLDRGGHNSGLNVDSNKSKIVGANVSSSRMKNTQTNSSSNINNINLSNNNNNKTSNINFNNDTTTQTSNSNTAAAENSNNNSSKECCDKKNISTEIGDSTNVTTSSEESDDDNDDCLIELMRWPYETEDLLQSIDKEEIPTLFADILETVPNIFYSGCVICQIRDFRQTFQISSSSCDIYHVLLRPTNESIISDINQLALDYDLNIDDKSQLEGQLVMGTAEPLCLNPDPKIGVLAINSQHTRQIWNTNKLRRQMKKYSQISINRKRRTDQFTHNYGLELCDYLQRLRQRPKLNFVNSSESSSSNINNNHPIIGGNISTLSSSFPLKLPRKQSDMLKPIRTQNLEYPDLISPNDIDIEKFAKAYDRPKIVLDCVPQLIEQYILEMDRDCGRIYHIKLSIFQRQPNCEYHGELYVDRDYKEGERNGEACRFVLGTRLQANRYIQQFTEIFTEEGRKSVKIIHHVPGLQPKVTYTTGMTEHRKQQQQQALVAVLQQQPHQLHPQQIVSVLTSHHYHNQQQQQQQQQQQLSSQQQAIQTAPQLVATTTPTINAALKSTNQLNILQGGNIVGIATQQRLHQPKQQQIFDGATVNVQTQPTTQQFSLSNGSLVLLQQPCIGQSITIQTSGAQQNATTKLLTNTNQLSGNALRTQLTSNVPILQTQLKATPIVTGHQQPIIQQKLTPATSQTINALVTGIINSSNQLQHQQQVQQQSGRQHKSRNAAILSLLNSAPAAMTNTPIFNNNLNSLAGQQQSVSTDNFGQRKQNDVMQNFIARKLSLLTNNSSGTAMTSNRANTNLIAVNVNQQDMSTQAQNTRVTMSALASQLASPPAVMTNAANFAYVNASTATNNNSIKILSNSGQRVINTTTLRRDSNVSTTTAAMSPGSDSNTSNASGASSLGFTMPGLSALLTSPTLNNDTQQQQQLQLSSSTMSCSNISQNTANQSFLERMNTTVSPSPVLSPQQQQQSQQINVAKNIAQHITNVQSPIASISPLSSPPPQPSPQTQTVQQQPMQQTTTLNLQGINFQSLQGAMATFPGIQNVQLQIPGLTQPISLSLSGATLAAAVQQQANAANAASNHQQVQQTTNLLVSVPVTSTAQANTIQTVHPSTCGAVVSAVPVTPAATQTVVLTNATSTSNSIGSVSGSMLSLPIAQLVASGVKCLNTQAIRTTGPSGTTQGSINANIIHGSSVATTGSKLNGATLNVADGSTTAQPMQLLGIQQRSPNFQVVSTKQTATAVGSRTTGQLVTNQHQHQQLNLENPALKAINQIPVSSQIASTTSVASSPFVMTTQKVHLKLQKTQPQIKEQTAFQQQQQTHLKISGTNAVPIRNKTTPTAANQNLKLRTSATDVYK